MTAPASRPARAAQDHDRYEPLTRRHRLWIVALAVATAVAVILTLLDPPGGVRRPRGAGQDGAAAGGASGNGVGGLSEVLPRTQTPPASR